MGQIPETGLNPARGNLSVVLSVGMGSYSNA